jgi:type II secretory pathway pseudopilin PulG
MGQQQLLLIILGVIIVGIAIAVGLSMFSAQSVQANKDALIADLNNIAANAYQYRIRPASLGGGDQTYTNYTIPSKLATNENGTYTTTSVAAQSINITATAASNAANTVKAVIDSTGRLTTLSYTGEFQ